MGGTVNKNDALRIGRGIQNIERLTQKNTTGLNRPVRTKTGIPAKITAVGEFGLYDLIEQQINVDGNGFEDKEPIPRIWDDSDEELPQAFEINGTSDLDTDLIVYIYRQSNDESVLNQWFFDSSSNTGDSSTATDKSNTSIKGKIQFRNDIPFNDNLQGPFDFEFQAPKQVGSLTDGNRAYGGNEDGVDNFAGIQRHYKWMWYKPSVTEGYLMPGTAAFKQSENDEIGLQFLNQMWIRMDHRFDGQVNEVHHGLCARDFFDQAGPPFPGRFSETPAGGVQATVWGSATSGGPTNIKCEYDTTGHLRKLDDQYGDEDEYPTDVNIKQTSGTYPSSESLYNTLIDQTANLIDENNVDTNAFNGPVGTLVYTAIGTNGNPLNIGFTVSTGFSLSADATEYNGAGTGGNDTAIFWDLSKHLDGSDVTLTSLLLEKNRSSTAKITDVESVQLVTSIETTPVPDDMSFDVKVELQHGIGGTQAQGTEFIRFNADGEYQIVVFLFLKADAANFNPDDAQTFLLKADATVADQGTFSGNTVSFSFNFDDTDSGSDVCARAFLEFFNTAVNPQPLPSQIGFCDISNANDFDEDCQPIAGTVATGTLEFANDLYNPESVGPNVLIDGVDFRQINPIVVIYKIQKGGDTTEFSTANATSKFQLFRGTDEVLVAESEVSSEQDFIFLSNPTDGQATDGFELTIIYMEESKISDGQDYVGKAFTDGVSDSPAVDEFGFNSTSAFLATDFFGDNSEDLTFPWSDFGGGDGSQPSTGVKGTQPFDTRWNRSIGTNAPISEEILSGALKVTEQSSVVQDERVTYSTLGISSQVRRADFVMSCDVNISGLVAGNPEVRGPGFFFQIIFSGVNYQLGYQLGVTQGTFFIESNMTNQVGPDNSTGGSFNFEYKRINGTFTILIDSVDVFNESNTATLLGANLFIQNSTPGGTGVDSGFDISITNFEFTLADHLGTQVDYFGPNAKRWSRFVASNNAYQFVSPAVNSLEQILLAFAGFDSVNLNSRFGADRNITTTTWKIEANFADMIFAGSGTETCMFQVTNVALDTFRIGWRNTGSGQTFFVAIGGIDQFTESNVTSSGKVKIERSGALVRFFNEDSEKFTFDDANSPLTDIDIITSSTLATAFNCTYQDIDIQSPTGTQFTFNIT